MVKKYGFIVSCSKAFAYGKIDLSLPTTSGFKLVQHIVVSWENGGYQRFPLFPTMLSKDIVLRLLKLRIVWFIVKTNKLHRYSQRGNGGVLTHIMSFSIRRLFRKECKARSACTYVQANLALHTMLVYH